MIDEETKTQLLNHAFALYEQQRWGELLELFDDDIVWHDEHAHADHAQHKPAQDEPRDYRGKVEVESHLKECSDHVYNLPEGWRVEREGGDWASASDLVHGEAGPCVDLYRFKQTSDGQWKIIECWTCLTHPMARRVPSRA